MLREITYKITEESRLIVHKYSHIFHESRTFFEALSHFFTIGPIHSNNMEIAQWFVPTHHRGKKTRRGEA